MMGSGCVLLYHQINERTPLDQDGWYSLAVLIVYITRGDGLLRGVIQVITIALSLPNLES